MSNTTTNDSSKNNHRISSLDRFNITFEYDKTLQEIKKDVRARTI